MATPPDFSSGAVLTAAQMSAIGMWQVGSTTATSGTTAQVLGCFTTDYDCYKIVISDLRTVAAASFTMQLLQSSTPVTTNYGWGVSRVDYAGALTGTGSGVTPLVSSWNSQMTNQSTQATSFIMEIQNPFLSQYTYAQWESTDNRGGSGYARIMGGGTQASTSSFTGIRFTLTASSITNMNIDVFGYRK